MSARVTKLVIFYVIADDEVPCKLLRYASILLGSVPQESVEIGITVYLFLESFVKKKDGIVLIDRVGMLRRPN